MTIFLYTDKLNDICAKPHRNQWNGLDDTYGQISNVPVVNFYKLYDAVKSKSWGPGRLTHPRNVLQMLGFVEPEDQQRSEEARHWDLLWSIDVSFMDENITDHLRPNQKVSQVPGMHRITHKAQLTTAGHMLKYVPKSFLMPQHKLHFLEEVMKSKDLKRRWIQKNIAHRGIKVKKLNELDFKNVSIIQEFVSNPFLADGRRKLSFSVYVIVTSIEPLRVYMMDTKYVVRFCTKAYDPEDFTDKKSFITDGVDMSNPAHFWWELARGPNQITRAFNYREIAYNNAYLRPKGIDTRWVQTQLYDAVRDVFEKTKSSISTFLNPASDSYFCLTRWDFVPDENFKLHLLEANMSPNMPAGTDHVHTAFFTSTLYSLLRVTGINDIRKHNNTRRPAYIVRDSDVVLNNIKMCYDSGLVCDEKNSSLCPQCMTEEDREIVTSLFIEHLNRNGMKRIFHTARMGDFNNSQSTNINVGDKSDDLYYNWLSQKCQKDAFWCE